ncbi:DJ-1/PfpI family protein [Streptomyces sp. NPDC001700]
MTSVCTGSLALAAAWLLDGYRAATHWSTRDHLARLGVEVSTERVCIDRNRFSGGGVTAGIDFGLTVIAHVLGEKSAKLSQLAMEYDPKPPIDAGSPRTRGPKRWRCSMSGPQRPTMISGIPCPVYWSSGWRRARAPLWAPAVSVRAEGNPQPHPVAALGPRAQLTLISLPPSHGIALTPAC